MIAYASSTGTRRNIAVMRREGWRIMISAKGNPVHHGMRYALDNGAWHSFINGKPFDETAFLKAYDRFAETADFIVLPDIVAGGARSLEYSLAWRERLGKPVGLQLLAVQDGMDAGEVVGLMSSDLGIFVGGTTRWKEDTLAAWGRMAHETGCYLHVGRVNSARRIHLCVAAGVDSFDGSSVTRYAKSINRLENARQQMDLLA